MDKHPEQDLINIIIVGDLAGVEEENWQEWVDAKKKLSPDGYKEYERQHNEVIAEYEKHTKIMDEANDNGTRH